MRVTPKVHAADVSLNNVPRHQLPGNRCLTAPTLTALITEVAYLIEECLQHGGCYFVIEAPEQRRYVQGLIRAGSPFWLESVSDASLANCCEEHCLTARQEHTLTRLAWCPPDKQSPNWYRALDTIRDPTSLAAELLVRTFAEVHQARVDSRLEVTIGEAIGPTRRRAVDRRRAS